LECEILMADLDFDVSWAWTIFEQITDSLVDFAVGFFGKIVTWVLADPTSVATSIFLCSIGIAATLYIKGE